MMMIRASFSATRYVARVAFCPKLIIIKSGQRDSDSQCHPPKGCALPNQAIPRYGLKVDRPHIRLVSYLLSRTWSQGFEPWERSSRSRSQQDRAISHSAMTTQKQWQEKQDRSPRSKRSTLEILLFLYTLKYIEKDISPQPHKWISSKGS